MKGIRLWTSIYPPSIAIELSRQEPISPKIEEGSGRKKNEARKGQREE